ncbi:MAG TPA: helix-turn-helix transcriptional regulator [Terriglobia bacterium]|nr:helix-turn-helix transcriptional regulator [Terriglobia bacterium]
MLSMPDLHNSVLLTSCAGIATNAGLKLKQIRGRLNLTLRAVEEFTLGIAEAEHNSEFNVSVARLNQIENDGSLPSVFKLYSLAVVYHMNLNDVLALYQIDLGKMEEHRRMIPLTRTHPFSASADDPERTMRFPIRFDPGFRPEKTAFISRLIETWGEIPLGLLATLDFKTFRYGYIGLDDHTMGPLLRPGSIVQIDEARRRVMNDGWVDEAGRPIYFIELRYSYECCWCFQRGKDLTMIPHPLSTLGPRTIRVPDEGEVLGQVVGVAMRLVQ